MTDHPHLDHRVVVDESWMLPDPARAEESRRRLDALIRQDRQEVAERRKRRAQLFEPTSTFSPQERRMLLLPELRDAPTDPR